MKLTVLLSRVPYPTEKGDKLRAFHQLRCLSKNHEITLIALTEKALHPDALAILNQYCSQIHIFRLSKAGLLWNLFLTLFSSKPFQTGYFYRRSIKRKIDSIITTSKPDHIYCQLIRMTEYVRNLPIPKTLDFQDVFSMGMFRRLNASGILFRPILRMEYHRLLNYEKSVMDDFNHATIISRPDQELIPHPAKRNIVIVPNGVDFQYFQPRLTTKTYDIVFTGNMGYPPNVDAAEYLVKDIIPLVRKKLPDVKILLAGASPHPRVKMLESEFVTVSGWVDDIRDSYASSRIFIAPMRIGTGLQNKLLEAMAMKIPCITSPLANNALEAKENDEILVGKNEEELAGHIISLLQNDDLARILAENGHKYVLKKFIWESSTDILEHLIMNTSHQSTN